MTRADLALIFKRSARYDRHQLFLLRLLVRRLELKILK